MKSKQEQIDGLREMLITESDLAFLQKADDTLVAEVHKEIKEYIERLELAQKPLFQVMALATKFMPNFIITKIAKDYLTPYVMAQVSQYLEPRDAANLGKSFGVDVLAQVALHTEPKLTAVIADKMGVNSVSKIVDQMIRLDFFLRLGEVSDVLSLPMLLQLTDRIQNPTHLAKIAGYMNDLERVKQVADKMPAAKKERELAELQNLNPRSEILELFS